MAFEPRPSYNPWNRQRQIGLALDTPYSFTQALGENFGQGILDSFGLGSVTRDLMTGGNALRPSRLGVNSNPLIAPLEGAYALRDLFDPDRSKPLSKEEYEASPFFRKDIAWDQGFTEDRAASLAALYDKKKTREHFSQKQPVAAFLGQLGGQAFDPINYVPVFGPAVQAAAVAKFGSVTGRMLVSASDAAINTAAFGVLTAGIRQKYGDDVSFQAIATEIAMSAVIGGGFGGIAGGIAHARGLDKRKAAVERTRERSETLGNTMEARAALNDAVAGLVEAGEVRLNPNSLAAIEKLSDEALTASSSQKALAAETRGIAGSKAGEVVIAPSGARVNVRPELVEAASLTHASGNLQVRDRASAQSAAQVEQIATGLDPARLMPNVDGAQGAPLVGADGVIDSGNGRVMAINRAYDAYPERAEAYRQALVEAGYPEAATMERPVLVSRRLTELSPEARAQFNAELNGPTTARMSAVELAAMDRNALDEGVMDALDSAPITAASNRAFVGRFLARLPANERGALVDAAGNLSADGQRRVENALVAAAYGDADAGVLRRFAEATDDNTRAIVGALSDVAGKWAKMRHAIKRGEIAPEFDMTEELTQAVRLLGSWREQAAREGRPVSMVIREGLAQLDLLSGEISPEAQVFVRMFYQNDHFARAVGREVLSNRLEKVIAATEELGRPSLFGDTLMPTKGEVLTNAQREQADIFTADGLEPRPETLGRGGEGSAAGEAGAADRPGVEGGDPINVTMATRFEAAGRPADEAAAAGRIIEAFYATQAQRLGTTADELVERFGLPEVTRGAADSLTPEQMAQMGLDIHRDVDGRQVQFDDEVQAQVFDLGAKLAQRHGIDPTLAIDDEFGAVPLGDLAGEAKRLFDEIGPYIDAGDERLASPEDFARLAVQHWGAVLDEAKGKQGKVEASTLIYTDQQRDWNQRVLAGLREEVLAAQKAGKKPRAKLEQLELFQSGRDVTASPEFKAWFGDSKVVDEGGKPLVVHHGSPVRGIEAFDPAKMNDKTQGTGFWFSEQDKAGTYAGEAGEVYPVYLKMERPIVVEWDGHWADGPTLPEFRVKRKGVWDRAYYDSKAAAEAEVDRLVADGASRPEFDIDDTSGSFGKSTDEWVRRMRERHPDADGIILRNVGGGGEAAGGFADFVTGDEYVVFSPEQIKSVNNHGSFDPADPRILFQSGPAPRGSISLDRNLISLFETADASTALHETGHLFLSLFKRLADGLDAPKAIVDDFATVKAWWGDNAEAVAADANASGRAEGVTAEDVKAVLETGSSGDKVKDLAIDVGLHEQWARGFEAYLREGKAPSKGLAGVFEQFKAWLSSLYREAQALNVNLSDDIRGVFDRLIEPEPMTPEQRAVEQAAHDAKASVFPPAAVARDVARVNDFIAAQPDRSLDDAYAVIGAHQEALHARAQQLASEHGATWKNPGLKKKETAAEKMVRKAYTSTKRLTDLVRGGFVVGTPAQADTIVDGLRQSFDVFDEGWTMTAVNYFDRKVLVRFDDGTVGEVQFWHPEMLDAKQNKGGHQLYEVYRQFDSEHDPRAQELFRRQRELYAASLPEADPSWVPVINGLLGRSTDPGNAARNAASEIGLPESMTSAQDVGSQAAPSSLTNSALPSSVMTAGRASQLKHFMGDTSDSPVPINGTEPAPDPAPDGLAEAAARVGRGEAFKQMAETHGLAEDGSFVEQADIEQMRQAGALSPEDEAELLAAQQAYDNAEAYSDTLAVAARCVIG